MGMKVNKVGARHIAAEFAALLLERAVKRGDFLPYVREVYGATAEAQPASVENVRHAIEGLVNSLWHKSFRFPPSRSKENVPQMDRAIRVFASLFPPERSAEERAAMLGALERKIAATGGDLEIGNGPRTCSHIRAGGSCTHWDCNLGCTVPDFSKCPGR